jgi:putative phosphoribosyl transferase
LNRHGLATLLLDLLTDQEQQIDSETMQYRFDIPLLTSRTLRAVNWARVQPGLKSLPIGLFGASTGAAAALIAAAADGPIAAVVSRGGRPDLAENALESIQAPTLLLVGGEDRVVLGLNKKALRQMNCIKTLKITPGATHLFEEPGALTQVAEDASNWFVRYFRSPASQPAQGLAG